jgi:hypothetical protein
VTKCKLSGWFAGLMYYEHYFIFLLCTLSSCLACLHCTSFTHILWPPLEQKRIHEGILCRILTARSLELIWLTESATGWFCFREKLEPLVSSVLTQAAFASAFGEVVTGHAGGTGAGPDRHSPATTTEEYRVPLHRQGNA